MDTLTIDFTQQLAPLIWAFALVLIVAGLAIIGSAEQRALQRLTRDRREREPRTRAVRPSVATRLAASAELTT